MQRYVKKKKLNGNGSERREIRSSRKRHADLIAKSRRRSEVDSIGLYLAFTYGHILELTEEERASIYIAPEFLDFVEQSTKIVQRALNDGYDYIRDYTIGAEADG